MSTRHERRKAAKARHKRKLEGLAQAAIAARTNAIVRANMAKPIEFLVSEEYGRTERRNYYAGIRSSVALCESAGARHGGHSRTQVRLGKIVKGKYIPA